MKSVVIMNYNVSQAIINHAFIDEYHECGGYLLGHIKKINGILHFYIENIYYETAIKGKDCTFIFPLLYEARANAFAKQKNIEIIGCYHSHAQYPSIFSDVDNNILKPYWASDKLCMIFSPKYFTLNCETVFKDKTTEKVDVFIKDGKKYLIFERFYSQHEPNEKHL